MAITPRKKVLLLTLVHPDYLPPVYAIAQVIRDEGYDVHILTFDPFAPSTPDMGDHATLESVGKHHGIGLMQRLSIRRKYTVRAHELVADGPVAIISFCAFTLLCGLKVKKQQPLVYHSLEMSDFMWSAIKRSPLSMVNNWRALKKVHKADMIATPSAQRSAWLVGRRQLHFMPYTVLNTVYLPPVPPPSHEDMFRTMLPPEHRGKKVVLYMGAVNAQNCVIDLVRAFGAVNDVNSVLLVAGMKENEYCDEVRRVAVSAPGCIGRVVFFNFMKGDEKNALQSNSDIGVCLSNERRDNAESMMTSPNKVGEYLAKGLYLLASDTEYMRPFMFKGVAALTASSSVEDIATAMRTALQAVENKGYKETIHNFVKDYYCMQQQAKPIVDLIKKQG